MSEFSAILPILSGMKLEMKKMADSVALMNKTHAQYLSEEWVTNGQAASILKVSTRTLQNLKSSGQLPHAKINGVLYFKTTDIEQLFSANYVSSATSATFDSPFKSTSNVSSSH